MEGKVFQLQEKRRQPVPNAGEEIRQVKVIVVVDFDTAFDPGAAQQDGAAAAKMFPIAGHPWREDGADDGDELLLSTDPGKIRFSRQSLLHAVPP